MEDIILNLKKVTLKFWEKEYRGASRFFKSANFYTVEAMGKGIKLGHTFPPVYIVQTDKNIYQINHGLPEDFDYGGLHRAVSHLKGNAPLKCKLLPTHFYRGDILPSFKNIDEAEIAKNFEYMDHFERAINHLPYSNAIALCKKYNLNPEEYIKN